MEDLDNCTYLIIKYHLTESLVEFLTVLMGGTWTTSVSVIGPTVITLFVA